MDGQKYGVNNQTGVKFDMPIHRLYRLTKDGKKIISLVDYTDRRNYQRMWDAWPGNDLKNGTIYKLLIFEFGYIKQDQF